MPLPFAKMSNKGRDEIIAVDLGGRHTKAVHLQNRGGRFSLVAYTIQDAPSEQGTVSVDVLTDHLKSVAKALGGSVKHLAVALGPGDTVVRRTEMPAVPVGDMRQLLKFNAKNYLQQDFPGHVFDCSIVVPAAQTAGKGGNETPKAGAHQKLKVIVGGAKQQLVNDVETAAKQAGLVATAVVPGLVSPINAFELAEPEPFSKEAVAIVDMGFRNSTICILRSGELVMHRVVSIGGDRFTAGLAEGMSISYAEAEGIKVGMAGEVQNTLEPLIGALGRELRAFIDFFEHQEDMVVSQVFLCGGSARSEVIVQTLQLELLVPCRLLNATSPLNPALQPEQMAELGSIHPQLAVAIGAGLSAL
jgi:type IV pilus assembly protein PilM